MNQPSLSEAPLRDFSVRGARRCAERGRLEAWIRAYLAAAADFHGDLGMVGDYHRRLGAWFEGEERFWIGPVEVPLSRLVRRYGPEETMPWREPRADWEKRVAALQHAFAHPLDMPPMIARAVEEAGAFRLLINDGAHRHEALKRLGETTFWVIVWFDSAAQQQAFLNE